MKITKAYLREIVREESQNLLLERQLYRMIDEEAAKLGLVLTEKQKKGVMNWLRRNKQKLAAAAAGLTLGGFLMYVDHEVGELEAATQDRVVQMWQNAQAAKETPEGKVKAIEDFLYTPTGGNKWVWGEQGTTELFSSFNTDRGPIMVAPPEFSVLFQVQQDFESDQKPKFGPGAKSATPPAGDIVGSADYADMAKEKVRADQYRSLPVRGLAGAVFIPMEHLDSTMHMENSDVSPEQLYVQYWDRFIGYD